MKSEPVISESVISKPAAPPSLAYARRFHDLAVYKKARTLGREIFTASKKFPKEESFALTDQLRRSARSVGAQIAEAWAKRRYPKHFTSKLTDADGEQQETQHWLTVAFDCGYLSKEEAHRLGALCLEVGCMLGEMIAKSGQFCQSPDHYLHETADYRIEPENCLMIDD